MKICIKVIDDSLAPSTKVCVKICIKVLDDSLAPSTNTTKHFFNYSHCSTDLHPIIELESNSIRQKNH